MVSGLGLTTDSKEATKTTIEINSALYDVLDFEDDSEYKNAAKGLIDGVTLEFQITDEVLRMAKK